MVHDIVLPTDFAIQLKQEAKHKNHSQDLTCNLILGRYLVFFFFKLLFIPLLFRTETSQKWTKKHTESNPKECRYRSRDIAIQGFGMGDRNHCQHDLCLFEYLEHDFCFPFFSNSTSCGLKWSCVAGIKNTEWDGYCPEVETYRVSKLWRTHAHSSLVVTLVFPSNGQLLENLPFVENW